MYVRLCVCVITVQVTISIRIQVGLVKIHRSSSKMSYAGLKEAEILSSKIKEKTIKSRNFYSIATKLSKNLGIVRYSVKIVAMWIP